VPIDTDPAFGWLVKVDNKVNALRYTVELRSRDGVSISRAVNVTFTSDCTQNLAIVNFGQTRPF
jgi:hypothetical protein